LFLTKSSLLKLIKRWKFLLVQTAKMCVFSLSKKKAKVFELVLRSIFEKKRSFIIYPQDSVDG